MFQSTLASSLRTRRAPASVPSMLPADLVFIKGDRVLDEPIKWVTGSKYTHVAGYIQGSLLIEAQGLRKTGYQSVSVYKKVSDVYRCPSLSWEQRLKITEFVAREIGSRYDYLLLLWELVRYVTGLILPHWQTNRRICSTLWADAYKSIGVDLCPGVRYPTPGDLAKSTELQRIGSY